MLSLPILDTVSPAECANYFANAGYDQNLNSSRSSRARGRASLGRSLSYKRCAFAGLGGFWGTRVSPSTVSNLNQKIYAKIEAWRNRRIEGEHPYLYLDGIVMKRSWAGEVRYVSLLVASAVNSEGFREILGICEGAKEDTRYQRCMVHFYRNVFSHVPSTRVREVSHMLKAIHAQESREAADNKAQVIIGDLRASKMGKAADLVEQAVHETLTYYGFPDIHWQKIRTNNPLERIMKEIRRRTRVVGAFPDGQSCLNLAAARLRYIAGTTWSAKCYMNMRPLYQQHLSETEAVA